MRLLERLGIKSKPQKIQEIKISEKIKQLKKPKKMKKKKTVPKKTTPKKTASKKVKTKVLKSAPDNQRFWVNNGPVLKNLVELKDALKKVTKEQFDFHTKREGNDFANWVKDILHLRGLADKITKTKTRKDLVRTIENYLK